MNILQILPELNYGGVETGTVDMAKYLVRNGHKAVVVSTGGQLVKSLELIGAVHYVLPVNKKSLFSMIKCVGALARVIRKEDIQIVHARSRIPAWIAYAAARLTNTVFVTTCHGYYSKHLLSNVMGWGKLVIVPSQIVGRRMIDDFSVAAESIRFIPRGVDIEKFSFIPPEQKKRTEFVIAIVGRITPIKGHMQFIKAIQKVSRIIPNIKVRIIGSAPRSKLRYKEDLQVMIKRLGLSGFVEFLGARNDIPKIFSDVNLLVMASTRHEAFGRVIIEAFASGVPVVATKVGGVVDIVDDGIDGVLVPPGNPESLADGMIRILRDLEYSSLLAKNAFSKVNSKFTLEKMAEETVKVYQEAFNVKRVLVIKLSALGDLILSIPALKAIRKKFPAPSQITCITSKPLAALLVNCPHIDQLLVYDYNGRDKGWLSLIRIGRHLRGKNFDLSIDLQNNRKSHILSMLAFSPRRYGYKNGKFSFLLSHKARQDKFILGPVEHQFRILKMLDIELKDKKIELWPSKDDQQYIDAFLESEWVNKEQILVGIHIGSSKRWVTKRWPLEYVGKICENLGLKDIRAVLTGEDIDAREFKALQESTKKSRPIIACGKTTINQLCCLIKRCNVFIAGDTAPLHIASGVGAPIIALFGPTDPRRHLPSSENIALLNAELACQPCYKSKCASIECMKQISVEKVEEAIFKLLKMS